MSARAEVQGALVKHFRQETDAEGRARRTLARYDAERPNTEAYPGELDMLRGLVHTLRVVVEHGDLPEVRQLLAEHQRDEADAYAQQPEKFFGPGRTYRSTRCADLVFECLALGVDPDTDEQQAIGWRFGPPRKGVRKHRIAALSADDWSCCGWSETEGGD